VGNILLAGEQVTGVGFEIKGFDYFGANTYKEDGQALVDALEGGGHTVTWMRTNHVAVDFPETLANLQVYDTIILSDVGSNTLLFHPEMLSASVPHPNRLKLIAQYVEQGGGLIMIGGWMSFSGIDGKAKYHDSFLEKALPVDCLPHDDRQERPEGITPTLAQADHPVLEKIPADWPCFLGYNKVTPKPEATTLLLVDQDPLLSIMPFGKGRSAAFTSDCAPHWGPPAWLAWPGYALLWNNLVKWVSSAK